MYQQRRRLEVLTSYTLLIGACGPLEPGDLKTLDSIVWGLKNELFTEPGIYLVTPDPMTFQITTKDVKRIDVPKGEKE